MIYFDDILVFLLSMEEHTQQVWLVHAKLQEHMQLYVKSEKCEFDYIFVEFLRYVIRPKGITIDK